MNSFTDLDIVFFSAIDNGIFFQQFHTAGPHVTQTLTIAVPHP